MIRQVCQSKTINLTPSPDERAYALVVFLLLVLLGSICVAGSLQLNGANLKAQSSHNLRTQRFYSTESTLAQVGAWLRDNSKNMYSLFLRENFYTAFSRSVSSTGGNDLSYTVPTLVKVGATTNSAILTNSGVLGSTTFPNALKEDGSTFDVQASFSALDFGANLVKVTLVNAIAEEPGKDYGSAAPAPETDFYPVFRIDVMSATDQGSHIFGYHVGSLASSAALGFFGKIKVTCNQDCDSYNSEDGTYGSAAAPASANCPVSSQGTVCVKNSTDVYGDVSTTGDIDTAGSCGGDICEDMACAATNDGCEGADCAVASMPVFSPWTDYCPAGSSQGNVTVSSGSTVTLTTGPTATLQCWSTVEVKNGGTLVLSSTSYPYYFDTLDMADAMEVIPDDPSKMVVLYVLNITGDRVNGGDVINSTSRPANFKMIYLGSNNIKLNGNADFRMMLVAPYVKVEVQGNADYYGGVIANELELTGSGSVHYDESMGLKEVTDVRYKLPQVGLYYR